MLDDKAVPISGWRLASFSYRVAIHNGSLTEYLVERIFIHSCIYHFLLEQ
jgi:hypothetical protein